MLPGPDRTAGPGGFLMSNHNHQRDAHHRKTLGQKRNF
jgi:hypothetical protein